MFKLYFTLISLLALSLGMPPQSPELPALSATAPKDITHCATEAFKQFTHDPAFMAAHEDPIVLAVEPQAGKKVSWPTPDGELGYGYEIEGNADSKKFLFVIHEWYGLNAHIKQEAEKLSAALGAEVRVIALDLYDKKVADNRDDARTYMNGVTKERAEAIIQGAINYAGEDAQIATIGWCFGGGWSMQSSLLAGTQAAGCVIYYGMPEGDVSRLENLRTDVLGIFATQDGWITPKVVSDFEGNMKKAGKNLTVHAYDAAHGFANPSNPKFDKDARAAAWRHTVAFLEGAFTK